MPLASGKRFFDGEISFSCLCFICGNERVNDLNSHGKADLQAEWAPGLGAAVLQGFPWCGRFLGVKGAVALVQPLGWC